MTQIVGIRGRENQITARQPLANRAVPCIFRLELQQDPLSDLPYLDRVRQTSAMKITFSDTHHLGLALQSSETCRVYDSSFVTLIFVSFIVGT